MTVVICAGMESGTDNMYIELKWLVYGTSIKQQAGYDKCTEVLTLQNLDQNKQTKNDPEIISMVREETFHFL